MNFWEWLRTPEARKLTDEAVAKALEEDKRAPHPLEPFIAEAKRQQKRDGKRGPYGVRFKP